MTSQRRPLRIIIDCDPGNGVPGTDVDDGLALALALSSPGLVLEAITVVSGNTPRDTGLAVVRGLLDRAGIDVPLIAGAAVPLLQDPAPWLDRAARKGGDARVAELWRGVPLPPVVEPPASFEAASEIARRVRNDPGEITLVAIGPLTNIAHALRLRPEIAYEAAGLVVMGRAFDVPTHLQELNFGYDPEAARIVFGSALPITLLPLDVTRTTRFTESDLDAAVATGSPLTGWLDETTRPWIRYCREVRRLDGCRLHDPLAVALLLDPQLVETEEWVVDVQVDGLARSRPLRWRADAVDLGAGLDVPRRKPVRVVSDVDNSALVRTIVSTLGSKPIARP